MANPVLEAQRLGQSIWLDNIRRGLLASGELQRLIDNGVTGLTSNPTIFEKAIAGSTDYDDALLELAQSHANPKEIFETLAIKDIQDTADLLRPIYDRTDGLDGYASLEVSPALAHDTEGTIAEAKKLFQALDRPNVLVKVPATPEGIPAIRGLIGQGVNVNVTLIFSLAMYDQAREAYIAGLEDLDRMGGDVRKMASVASFFVSRMDTTIDGLLGDLIREGNEEVKSLLGKAAVANSKLAYRDFRETFDGQRFSEMRQKGARLQRLLWGSSGTKNPAYSDVLYVENLIGPDTINTVPPSTLTAFMEHGKATLTVTENLDEAECTTGELRKAGIDTQQVTYKLLVDGVKAFADSFDKLLDNIEEKKVRLLSRDHVHPGIDLGSYMADVEATLSDLQRRDVVARIWAKDHTVWRSDPREIADRLGWLNITDLMSEQVSSLEIFAAEVRSSGYNHVVLLGMGGSSLGPEVLWQIFGNADGYPSLTVLDSTVPPRVQEVTDSIDPSRTLFLVSSKSGGTIEPLSLYKHFRALTNKAIGKNKAGQNFVAITDPGTSLEKLAREQGFRQVFTNPTDVGGRYSVLSYFGLVPAALLGIDLAQLLDRTDNTKKGCAFCVQPHDNPGAWLGAIMGVMVLKGRNQLTLITSPSLTSFGLWVEQLIAESTGKEGKGIIPIAGEPLVPPDKYEDDRVFVYLRLGNDDNLEIDRAVKDIQDSGQPLVQLDMADRYDLGAEFFRWEFAVALAGSILDIHPFDQPNVQKAKDQTNSVIREYQKSGKLPQTEASNSLQDLLSQAKPGDYLAILPYLRESQEVGQTLSALRRKVIEEHKIATTLGYGPRYLHSTGQLHKGGPNTGLFLQVTQAEDSDIYIPGEAYTFGVLANAQALGDLQVLQAEGRRVARIHLERGDGKALSHLLDEPS